MNSISYWFLDPSSRITEKMLEKGSFRLIFLNLQQGFEIYEDLFGILINNKKEILIKYKRENYKKIFHLYMMNLFIFVIMHEDCLNAKC